MIVQGATQGLVASFTFGAVSVSASAALFVHFKAHGSVIFRDGPRLVLITFLTSSFLWALLDLIATLVTGSGSTSQCQSGFIIIATGFDQVARFSIEQYLIWAIHLGKKVSAGQILGQVLLLARLILGLVLAGLTRATQTDNFCAAEPSSTPVAVATIILDVVILLLLVVQAYLTGLMADIHHHNRGFAHSRSLVLVMVGFTIWTGVSVTLVLGLPIIALVIRTTVPAIGLLIEIFIVMACVRSLTTTWSLSSISTESPSPRRIIINRDRVRGLSRFCTTERAPAKYEDLEDAAIRSSTTFIYPREAPTVGVLVPDNRTKLNHDEFVPRAGSDDALGGASPPGVFYPPRRAETAQATNGASKQQRNRLGIGRGPAQTVSLDKRRIGNPILQDNASLNPLNKIATMDLKEAAQADVERRAKALQESDLFANCSAPQPPSTAGSHAQTVSIKGKNVASPTSQPPTMLNVPTSSLKPETSNALSSSTLFSPGVEDLRRRSPRHSLQAATPVFGAPPAQQTQQAQSPQPRIVARRSISPKNLLPVPAKISLQRRPTNGFPSKPPQADPQKGDTVVAGATNLATATSKKLVNISDIPGSVVHRRRPVPRRMAKSPPIVPEFGSSLRRSMSGDSLLRSSTSKFGPSSPNNITRFPPLPKTAGLPAWPLSNETEILAVDKKTTLFSPGPTTGSTSRQTLVPKVPPLPLSYMDTTYTPTDDGRAPMSGRTTETDERRTSRGGGNSPEALTEGEERLKVMYRQHASSPVLAVYESVWTATDESRGKNHRMANFSPSPSPRYAVGAPVARQISNKATTTSRITSSLASSLPYDARGSELVTVMFDASPEEKQLLQVQWHRRVGDDCPTFSGRQEKVRSRKMSPPAPLVLEDRKPIQKPSVIRAREKSPIESPGLALRQIQNQLMRVEASAEDTLDSPSQRMALLEDLEKEMGHQENHWRGLQHDLGRDSLCSMASPSTRDFGADPLSGIIPISRASSIRSLIGQEPRVSRIARLAEAQTDFQENTMNLLVKGSLGFLANESPYATSNPPDSDNPDKNVPQPRQRPHEAHALVAQRAASQPQSFLWKPVSAEWVTTGPSLWKKVPREEAEHVVETPARAIRRRSRKDTHPLVVETKQLWQKPVDLKNMSTTGLWRPVGASVATPAEPIQPSTSGSQRASVQAPCPSNIPRPVTLRPPRRTRRATMLPDIVENPEPLPDKEGTLGIYQFPWGEKSDTASYQSRPVMNNMVMPGTMTSSGPSLNAAYGCYYQQMEPSEYSSFFDDYEDEDTEEEDSDDDDSEDEVSDDAKSEHGEIDHDEDADSDDTFDESMLWEIASLLRSDNVPSRNSLLPPRRPLPSAVDDGYIDKTHAIPYEVESVQEDQLGRAVDSAQEQSIGIGIVEEPETTPTEQSRHGGLDTVVFEPLLWSAPSPGPGHPVREAKHDSSSAGNLWDRTLSNSGQLEAWESEPTGLFRLRSKRPDNRTTPMEPAAKNMERKPRSIQGQPLDKLVSECLWARRRIRPQTRFVESTHGLWSPPLDLDEASRSGLFEADTARTVLYRRRVVYRAMEEKPAAKTMVPHRSRRANLEPLDQLQSSSMWAPAATGSEIERNWITGRVVATDALIHRQWRRPVMSPGVGHAAQREAVAGVERQREDGHARSASMSNTHSSEDPYEAESIAINMKRVTRDLALMSVATPPVSPTSPVRLGLAASSIEDESNKSLTEL